tara:strand:+ start:353 stop:469 length:117 start_codon:yes stop_codon:yes gene_type:complete
MPEVEIEEVIAKNTLLKPKSEIKKKYKNTLNSIISEPK